MTQKLTLTDLMKDKEKYQVKDEVTEELYIGRLDASITIEKPARSLVMDSLEMSSDDNQASEADAFLVYNIVVEPNLKDKELQKAYGCAEPFDIVNKIFEMGEVSNIAKSGLTLAGYDDSVRRVKDLKN